MDRSRPQRPNSLVILGAGYAGRFLYHHAKATGLSVSVTSRSPHTRLQFAPPQDRLHFDLDRESTWPHIPVGADVIWCFPALPAGKANAFADTLGSPHTRLLILGSTSAFPDNAGTLIDETANVDRTIPRVHSEENLRETCGAIILRLAGLYGPGRNVLDWIRTGKLTNRCKIINLIHIEDVAAICLAALNQAQPGQSYIVSDGVPRRRSEICEMAFQRWGIPIPPPAPSKNEGKLLSPRKIFETLGYRLRYPDLYEALD